MPGSVCVCVGGCTLGLRGSDVFLMLHKRYGSLPLSPRGVGGVGKLGVFGEEGDKHHQWS